MPGERMKNLPNPEFGSNGRTAQRGCTIQYQSSATVSGTFVLLFEVGDSVSPAQ
jgi:hypothetical protein